MIGFIYILFRQPHCVTVCGMLRVPAFEHLRAVRQVILMRGPPIPALAWDRWVPIQQVQVAGDGVLCVSCTSWRCAVADESTPWQ